MINRPPDKLINAKNWICHKGKVPKNPNNGNNLTGSYETWGTSYKVACAAVKRYDFDGLGFVFKASNNFCGIDIDRCMDNGVPNGFADDVIKKCNSYTEISPSGDGVHIIAECSNEEKISIKTGGVEIYNRDRYFTFTGNQVSNYDVSKMGVNDILNIKLMKRNPMDNAIYQIVNSGDDKLRALWTGDWKNLYDSQSEADFALCTIISDYVGSSEEMDYLFRKSGLMRPKWDRSVGKGKTYGQLTIEKTIIKVGEDDVIKSSISMAIEMDDFIIMSMPEIKVIMSPWLSFGSTHMVYAERGRGKTYFCMSLALAVAHNTNFGEWEVDNPVNTMYVDGEMLPQQMVERIKGLKHNLNKKEKNWFILSSGINLQRGDSAINIVKPYWQSLIFSEIQDKEIKLLFIDNIASLTPGIDENDATAWDSIASWVNKIKQSGCAVVLVHHAGKGGQQRGTSAREDALDTVIFLKNMSSDAAEGINVNVVFEKSRHIAGNAVSTCNFKLVSEPGSKNLMWDIGSTFNVRKSAAIRLLCDNISYADIQKQIGIGKSTITKYKQQAIKDGWIMESGGSITLTNIGNLMINRSDSGNDYQDM